MSEKEITLSTQQDAADLLMELRSRAEALERQLVDVRQQTEARIVRAELKAEAIRAGIVDPDGLKLMNTDAIKLNEDGEVEGAGALIADLKRAKPWLFGGTSSSSSSALAPPATPPRQKLATEMSDDEWRAARTALLKRRG